MVQGGLTSPEGRNVPDSEPLLVDFAELLAKPQAALFAQLDADGDGDVSLKEFHAAKVSCIFFFCLCVRVLFF